MNILTKIKLDSLSIRQRLLIWLLLPLLILSSLLINQAYLNAKNTVEQVYDKTLLALALSIIENVVANQGDLLSDATLEFIDDVSKDQIFYKVSGPDNAYITGFEDLPTIPQSQTQKQGNLNYYNAIYSGRPVRMVFLKRNFNTGILSGEAVIQVAMTRLDRDKLIQEMMNDAALRLLLLILVAVITIWFAVHNALKPLTAIQREISSRSDEDLEPIESPAPSEIQPVINEMNKLLKRLNASINALRRFIGDASHQLRTPLAALQTQIELAMRETEPETFRDAISNVQKNTYRTSRLANQLLSQARTNEIKKSEFCIKELAEKITREFVPAALEKNIDLGFEGSSELSIRADKLLISEVLKNLIDNAIGYSPADTAITVRVYSHGNEVIIEVEDQGEGIPESELDQVFERFYRLSGTQVDGCGLGLAIVKDIVESHSGQIDLINRDGQKGLIVRVSLPVR